MRHLALMYEDGQGTPKDDAQAAQWLHKAAKAGDSWSEDHLIELYDAGRGLPADQSAILAQFQAEADGGDPEAQTYLGHLYEAGKLVPRDYSRSFEWYQKAAAQGYARAENALGNAYRFSRGVKQDYPQAIAWYAKAAGHGSGYALNSLGYMYEGGIGVTQDFSKAGEYYREAEGYLRTSACNLVRLEALHLIQASPEEMSAWQEDIKAIEWCGNDIAWSMATNTDPKRRDPVQALQRIQSLIASSKQNWVYVDTLAAAYAATGDYVAAAKSQQEAIDVRLTGKHGEAGDPTDVGMHTRLALYQSGKPYLEPQD